MTEIFMPQHVGVPQDVHGTEPRRRAIRGKGLRRRPIDPRKLRRGILLASGGLLAAGGVFAAGFLTARALVADPWEEYQARATADCGAVAGADWRVGSLDFDMVGADGVGTGAAAAGWCLLDAAEVPRAVALRMDEPTDPVDGGQAAWADFRIQWWNTPARGLDYALMPASA